jgi:transcriptional regulator with XRE-family HTH domain
MDVKFDDWFYEECGKKIRIHRKRHRLSIEKLADLCGISANYFQEIETAKKHASLVYIHKILSVLEADYNEFFADLKPPMVRENARYLSIVRKK